MTVKAPLRLAVIALVEASHDKPFSDEDLHHLVQLDNGDFSLSRVRGFLTILVSARALVALRRGWTGRRFRTGRRWETWKAAEVEYHPGGNSPAYLEARAEIDRLHDLWRDCEARIRERIRFERQRQGLGMGTLAAKVGIRKDHLYRLETGNSGHKAVSLPLLVRVAVGLGLSLDQLVDWPELSKKVALGA